MLNRREVLGGIGGYSVLGVASPAFAASTLSLGSVNITSLSDGNLVLPGAFFFDGLPQNEVAVILAQHGLTQDQLEPPCNLTLMRDGTNTVLFDAGSGGNFMPSAGVLLESLDAIDVAADDITHVVFTHAHPDHLWGVLDDFDDLVFSNATYMIGQAEWDYWRDPNTVSTIGEARASFAVGAARRLEALEDVIQFFKDGDEVLPGVMAHGTFGHTPGHMSFEVRKGNEAVLIGGDAIGNHHVAFARPDWPGGADQDTERAAQTRLRLLDMLAQDQMALMGFHLPHGGLGRVARKDGAYQFIAEDA